MNKIKAIIFDLDDTLANTSGTIKFKIASKALKVLNPNKNLEEELKKHYESGLSITASLKKIGAEQGLSEQKIKESIKVYSEDLDVEGIKLFKGVRELLDSLSKKYYLALVTTGFGLRQQKKIDLLDIRKYFEEIHIDETYDKENAYYNIRRKLGLLPQSVLVVGNKLKKDLLPAKNLGFLTVLVGNTKTKDSTDYIVNNVLDINKVLKDMEFKEQKLSKGKKITLIGGGTGAPTLAQGLRKYTKNIEVIVTCTDRGRSSGRLHKELNVLPPGDVRNNIIALSQSEKLLNDLFQYRFEEGSLKGHTLGNLFIVALTKMLGSFEKAIEHTSKILNLSGKIIPASPHTTEICAELEDGTVLKGEQAVVVKGDAVNKTSRPPIKRAWLEPNVKASKSAVKSILQSDLVVIGPGSLVTSVLPPLLHEEIIDALKKTKAKKVYVCNIVTQSGQTQNFSAKDHADMIQQHIGKVLDFVVVNTKKPKQEILKSYEESKAFIVEITDDLYKQNYEVVAKDLIEEIIEKKILWEKDNLLRHDSEKIAKILMKIK